MDELETKLKTEELENYAAIIEEDYIVDLVRILNEEYVNTKRNNLQLSETKK